LSLYVAARSPFPQRRPPLLERRTGALLTPCAWARFELNGTGLTIADMGLEDFVLRRVWRIIPRDVNSREKYILNTSAELAMGEKVRIDTRDGSYLGRASS
jgi:hypothetical protein